jgi:beta-lactamase regulating signal transducer with metallopeptidase domain
MLAAPLVTASVLTDTSAASASRVPKHRVIQIEVRRGPMPGVAADVAPAESSSDRIDVVLSAAVVVWVAGVMLLALRLGRGWWRVSRLRQRARALEPSRWTGISQHVAARLGLRHLVRVVDTDLITSPIVMGWISPVIVLPLAAFAGLTPAQVEGILAHELAHIRRHDFLVNLLQPVVETLLFYHPVIWWISGRIRAEREHCCDDLAIAVTGDRIAYASALADLEAFRRMSPSFALAATGGSLFARVSRLLDPPPYRLAPAPHATAGALVLLIAVLCAATAPFLAADRDARLSPEAPETSRIALRWQLVPTEHFDIAAPPALGERTSRIETLAEAAYTTLRRELDRELRSRPRLLLFDNQQMRDIVAGRGMPPLPGTPHILLTLDSTDAALSAEITRQRTGIMDDERANDGNAVASSGPPFGSFDTPGVDGGHGTLFWQLHTHPPLPLVDAPPDHIVIIANRTQRLERP